MQRGVHGRFLDQSTSVREAAVELVGKFILIRPELIPKYYDMLSERILDTGISVRKRVIKIFKDICIDQQDFNKIPEMCVKMIRRVNDEEGIKVCQCGSGNMQKQECACVCIYEDNSMRVLYLFGVLLGISASVSFSVYAYGCTILINLKHKWRCRRLMFVIKKWHIERYNADQ